MFIAIKGLIANETRPCIKEAEKYNDIFFTLDRLFFKRVMYLFIYIYSSIFVPSENKIFHN